jgi:hypothetical protein
MSGGNLKLPAHVLFRKDLSLLLWKPHGILDEAIVNEIVAFIDVAEERTSKPFNRFTDLSALDMVDLNFKFVFQIGLHRRLIAAPHSPVKSAFYVTRPRDRSLRQTARDADRLFQARRGPVYGTRSGREMALRSS